MGSDFKEYNRLTQSKLIIYIYRCTHAMLPSLSRGPKFVVETLSTHVLKPRTLRTQALPFERCCVLVITAAVFFEGVDVVRES